MAQEFTIKSEAIESKINQLLPSQGGFQAGVDISASTMVIPIVDLTETASGSALRQDLQTSFGLNSTFNSVNNTTTTIINTTGYYRLMGNYRSATSSGVVATISITDGTTTTTTSSFANDSAGGWIEFDYVIYLTAGESCVVTSGSGAYVNIVSRQIADIDGNLTNP